MLRPILINLIIGLLSAIIGAIARYNRRAVEPCRKRVFCAAKEGLVLAEPRFAAK
jgi:hypothetical protein